MMLASWRETKNPCRMSSNSLQSPSVKQVSRTISLRSTGDENSRVWCDKAGHTHSHHHSQHSHSHDVPHATNGRRKQKRYKPTDFDMDKLRSTIKQFVRDWSEEVSKLFPYTLSEVTDTAPGSQRTWGLLPTHERRSLGALLWYSSRRKARSIKYAIAWTLNDCEI
jgi:hypothetical protein